MNDADGETWLPPGVARYDPFQPLSYRLFWERLAMLDPFAVVRKDAHGAWYVAMRATLCIPDYSGHIAETSVGDAQATWQAAITSAWQSVTAHSVWVRLPSNVTVQWNNGRWEHR